MIEGEYREEYGHDSVEDDRHRAAQPPLIRTSVISTM